MPIGTLLFTNFVVVQHLFTSNFLRGNESRPGVWDRGRQIRVL